MHRNLLVMLFILFISTDELGHGGPLTISDNINYGISKVLMEGATELGVPVNPSYNSGVNNGMDVRLYLFRSFSLITKF